MRKRGGEATEWVRKEWKESVRGETDGDKEARRGEEVERLGRAVDSWGGWRVMWNE